MNGNIPLPVTYEDLRYWNQVACALRILITAYRSVDVMGCYCDYMNERLFAEKGQSYEEQKRTSWT